MTSTKISAAIGLAYGEQGHYSTVTPVEEPQQIEKEMIPVRLEAQTLAAEGPFQRDRRRLHDGRDRLRHDGPGADAVGHAGYSRAASPGGWEL